MHQTFWRTCDCGLQDNELAQSAQSLDISGDLPLSSSDKELGELYVELLTQLYSGKKHLTSEGSVPPLPPLVWRQMTVYQLLSYPAAYILPAAQLMEVYVEPPTVR